MYNGIQKIEEIIEYIESNITSEPDCEAMASRMMLSVYEFRRIFAFIVGCPISDYVRKRRLSLAACEIMTSPDISIKEIGERYGYSTLSAFSKAFSEYHGFSPSVCRKDSPEISLFPRPEFEWKIRTGENISFQIISDTAFSIRGYSAFSDHTDSCCCEGVWNDFYESGADRALTQDLIYVSYHNNDGMVKCRIGERVCPEDSSEDSFVIPEGKWLSVKLNTTDDDAVNRKYNSILYELLPSARLHRRSGLPTVEIFPRDMSEDNFEWEIRIPVEKE